MQNATAQPSHQLSVHGAQRREDLAKESESNNVVSHASWRQCHGAASRSEGIMEALLACLVHWSVCGHGLGASHVCTHAYRSYVNRSHSVFHLIQVLLAAKFFFQYCPQTRPNNHVVSRIEGCDFKFTPRPHTRPDEKSVA